MNKRDWQADMALCEKATQEPWVSERAKLLPWSTVYPRDSFKFICERVKHEDADFIAESRTALPYWLQQYAEVKEERDGWRSLAENLNADVRQLQQELAAEKERVDKLQSELSEYTEAQWKAFEREQKLMGAIEEILKEDGPNVEPEAAYILGLLKNAMESLYPKEESI